MKQYQKNQSTLLAMLASAGLLSACGGGGSGETVVTPPPVTPTAAAVAISGTAAKGLMANADVAVFAANADGSLGSTALATTTTDAQGRYSLSFNGNDGRPFVVRVSAKADGSTTHADEVSGLAQALPAGFAMRSMLTPDGTGSVTVSASVTPFSEMAVAAAAKATGGLSTANAKQAVSTVTQLLGFNPTTVTATTLAAASGVEQQKLAVMLTAVSQLANSGGLNCSTGTAGDKTKCVVDALGAAASKDSIKLSGSGDSDVSATLSSALTTVLNSDAVRDKVEASVLTAVVANLGCTSNCTAAPVGTTPAAPSAAATAIAAAKLLFSEIKSDWAAMFSRGGNSSIAGGVVNKQAFQFNTAMQGIQAPVNVLARDLGAMLLGIDLFNDYKAGRTGTPSRGRAFDMVSGDGSADFSGYSAAGCTLYQDVDTSITATAPANARYIGCSARYYLSRVYTASSNITSEFRHGFTITPGEGNYGYLTRARRRDTTCTLGACAVTANAALQTEAAFAGTLTPTLTAADGSITSFTAKGELAAAFEDGGTRLVNAKHSLDVAGTQVFDAKSNGVSTLSGSIASVDAAGKTLGTLTLKSGRLEQVPLSDGSHEVSAVALNLVWNVGTAEFEGDFALSDSLLDKSGSHRAPSKLKLNGMLRTLASGVSTEFLSGKFSASTSGFAGFDASLPKSTSNKYQVEMAFVGSLTAPSRPTLEFSLGSTWSNDGQDSPLALSLQYRTLVSGKPRTVVTLNGNRDAQNQIASFTLSEATSGLAMTWVANAASADLTVGSPAVKVGTLTNSSGLMTFSDSSFMSLDIGL